MSPAPHRNHARRARELAASQFGVVTRAQLRAIGMTPGQVRNLTGPHGRWSLVTDEVLRLLGAPVSAEQRTVAAVLDAGPGARLASQSAASWWGLAGCPLEPTLVVRTSSTRRGSSLCRIRRVRFLPDHWCTVQRAVPVVRPELLALQLFADCHAERAERLVDRLWSRRLFAGGSLAAFLDDVPSKGVRGSAGLRRYFRERGAAYRPPDSGLESRFQQLVQRAGWSFRRQVDLGDDGTWAARVDFVHEVCPLVVEIQSEAYHSALSDRRHDRERLARLRAAGFTVVEVTDTMVWTAPDHALRLVQHGLQLCCGTGQG